MYNERPGKIRRMRRANTHGGVAEVSNEQAESVEHVKVRSTKS